MTTPAITIPEPGRTNWYHRVMTRCWWRMRQPFLRRRLREIHLVRFEDLELVVLPSVLDPILFRSGAILAKAVVERGSMGPTASRQALDMGTGTGLGVLVAAKLGYRAVGVDINPEAVRCARINILLNGLDGLAEAIEGDLFHPVAGKRYDLILFNPPFFSGRPRNASELSWRSPDVFARFAAGLRAMLAPDGVALVVLSTDGDEASALEHLRNNRLSVRVDRRRDLGNEVFTVYEVTDSVA